TQQWLEYGPESKQRQHTVENKQYHQAERDTQYGISVMIIGDRRKVLSQCCIERQQQEGAGDHNRELGTSCFKLPHVGLPDVGEQYPAAPGWALQ
ncbi:hypothetical protein, partial [Pseudomonas viridiflava]|uniref:hypothetical protein n=1 Tax=Pseudomonas viridiflava TaxID=33069 RepID=UPI00197E6D9E